MTSLAQLVRDGMQGRSVQQAADEWHVPYWIVRDIIYGKSKKPSREHLEAIARGSGIPLPQLVLAAYDPAPQEVSA